MIASLMSFSCFAQTNYYVAANGDNNDNGSLGSPWETVQHGINQLTAGDILHIRGGNYIEKVSIPNSGTSGNWITIRNYEGEQPVLDATGLGGQDAVLLIDNKSYIMIDGLEIANNIKNNAQGILVEGGGDYITLQNCKIHDIHFSSNVNANVTSTKNSQPLIVYGTEGSNAITNLVIQNNEIYDSRTGHSEGLAVNGNVDGFEILNNTVHDLTNIGIDIIGHEGTSPNASNDQARNGLVKNNTVYNCIAVYATSGGIYIDGGRDIIVENNASYHNGYGIEIGCENKNKTTSNITVRNNLFYDNEISGLTMGGFDYPSSTGKVIDCLIRNNTFFQNNFKGDFTGEVYLSYSENCVVVNNIFYASSQNVFGYVESSQPNLVFDYNVVYCQSGANSLEYDWNGNFYANFAAFKAGTGLDANSLFVNPLLVSDNLATVDLHLQSTSPAVDAGSSTYPLAVGETDMDSQNRLEGSAVDIGADEYLDPSASSVSLQVKAFLEGAYVGSEMMAVSAAFRANIPLVQSYNQSPWNYTGTETVATMPNTVVDWVLVELRQESDTNLVAQQAALLLEDGTIVGVDYATDNSINNLTFNNVSSENNYFVLLRHRHHIALISKNAISLSTVPLVDFTQTTAVMEGASQLKEMADGQYALHAGDVDGNGVVTLADFNAFLNDLAQINGYFQGDLTMDNAVTVEDYNVYQENASVIGVEVVRY